MQRNNGDGKGLSQGHTQQRQAGENRTRQYRANIAGKHKTIPRKHRHHQSQQQQTFAADQKPNHFNRTAFAPFHDAGMQKAEYHDGQKRIKKSSEWTGITALHTQIIAGQRIAFHHIEKHRIDGIHQHAEPHRINQAGDKIGFEKSVHQTPQDIITT